MKANLQQEAKALGEPTRHRIFRYVADAAAPVGVAELTAYMGLNHNAVRQHLAILVDAGLLIEEVEESGRPGRPRLLYRLHPETAGTWDTAGPYEYLASLLAEALEAQIGPRQVGQRAGRRAAGESTPGADPVDLLEAQMERRGFRPIRVARGSKLDLVLGRCPFEDVASSNPDTVCQLHLGLAEGIAEGLGGVEVVRLVAKNPHRSGCRVALRRTKDPIKSGR